MTLKNVVIDLSSRFFAPFMAYVALSRVVSFENLHLTRALKPSDIKIDIRAVNFTRDVSLLALSRQEEYIAKYGIAS